MQQDVSLQGAVNNAIFISDQMMVSFDRTWFSVGFYSNAGMSNQVTPSAGTVKIEGYDGMCWHSVYAGEFNAADVYSDTKEIPSAFGPLQKYRITLNGVTGATHFKVLCRRS